MERIILEVNNEIAKAWRNAPSQFKEEMERDLQLRIAQKIREAERNNFFEFLDKVQKKTSERGLTQETLEKLLNEKD
ncbi:MAG: hypothetical protein ACTHK0_06705 [Ginsengibacter sp.]